VTSDAEPRQDVAGAHGAGRAAAAGPVDGLSGILDAFLAISEELDLSTTLRRIVRAAADVVDAEYGALAVLDGRGGLAEFVYVGIDEATRRLLGPLPSGHGLVGLLIEHPQVMRLADLTTHPASVGFPPGHPVMHRFIGAPIMVREAVFGNLYLTEKRGGGEFTERDELVLRALASAAGSAVQNARLFAEVRQRERWLLATAEIRTALLSGGTVTDALALIARRAVDLAAADHALVLVAGEDGRLRVWGAAGPDADRLVGCSAGRDERWTRAVLSATGPGVPGEMPVPQDQALADLWRSASWVSTAGVPAGTTDGGVLICLRGKGTQRFADDRSPQLAGLAEQASLALEVSDRAEQRRRFELVAERERIARDLHDHVIQRLFAVGLSLQGQESRATDPVLRDRLEQSVQQVDESIRDLRSSIFDLRTATAAGGRKNLRRRLLDIAAGAGDGGPTVSVHIDGPIDTLVPPALAEQVEAVVREAVSNAVRHSGGRTVTVTVTAREDLDITVTDDGVGIPDGVPRSGLTNLADRAATWGGSFAVAASAAGGTTVHWAAPLPSE
jgi:signal transduction histidine kinase